VHTVPNPAPRVDAELPVHRIELLQMIAALVTAGLPAPIRIAFLDDVPPTAHPRLVLVFAPNRFLAVQQWANGFHLSAADSFVRQPGAGPVYTLSSTTGVAADKAPELFLGWHVILRCADTPPRVAAPAAADLVTAVLAA
jgi:hypothetical protein